MLQPQKVPNGKIEPGLYMWPTKKIRPNPDQPRKYFNPVTMEGLKKSIAAVGILSPPFVSMPDKDGYVDLLDGERRLRAVLELKLKEIPVFIGEADKKDAFLVSVASNFCRDEMSEIEDALAIQRLRDDYEYDLEYIADLMGKSIGWVYNRLKYLKLHPDLAIDLQEGKLSPKLALAVTSFPREHQKRILEGLKAEENKRILSSQQTTRLAIKISQGLGIKPLKTKKGTVPLDFATRLVLAITSTSNKLSDLLDELLSDVTDKELNRLTGEKLQNLDFELKELEKKLKEAIRTVSDAF